MAYKIHALAGMFPLVDTLVDEIAAELKKTRKRPTITLYQGKVLDGRHRYLACVKAGIDPIVKEFTGKDPRAFVIRSNVTRRHLTPAQKRELLEISIKADPNKSDRQHAAAAKADPKTATRVRRGLERRGDIPHATKRTDSTGRSQPSKRAKPLAKGKPGRKPRGEGDTASRLEQFLHANGLSPEAIEEALKRAGSSKGESNADYRKRLHVLVLKFLDYLPEAFIDGVCELDEELAERVDAKERQGKGDNGRDDDAPAFQISDEYQISDER